MKITTILLAGAGLSLATVALADAPICPPGVPVGDQQFVLTYHSVDSHVKYPNGQEKPPVDVNVSVQAETGNGCIQRNSACGSRTVFVLSGPNKIWSVNAQLQPAYGIFYGAIQGDTRDHNTISFPVGGGPNGEKDYGVCYSTQGPTGPWIKVDKGMQHDANLTGTTKGDVYLMWAQADGTCTIR
jgi:hypothetical protein